jgi:hypothetical protein
MGYDGRWQGFETSLPLDETRIYHLRNARSFRHRQSCWKEQYDLGKLASQRIFKSVWWRSAGSVCCFSRANESSWTPVHFSSSFDRKNNQ